MIFAGLRALAAKTSGIVVVLDDVDFFPAQFADDRLHAHALHAHARAHAVHVRILGVDRHFGALSRLARDGLDHHRAVVDFRDFHLEQLLHQQGVSARNHHLRARARRDPLL